MNASPAELYLSEFVTLLQPIGATKPLRFAARCPRRSRCTRHLRTCFPLLFVAGDGEVLTPLATARVDHGPTASGFHPRAEPVCPKTALTMWLIGPLHN